MDLLGIQVGQERCRLGPLPPSHRRGPTLAKQDFPGYPAYLELASKQLGHPEAAGPATRISTLAAMANLCAQAILAAAGQDRLILAKATEFRDQLWVAATAADLMLDDLAGGSERASVGRRATTRLTRTSPPSATGFREKSPTRSEPRS